MTADKTAFPNPGNWLKFDIELTMPNPGPTLPMQAAEPEKALRMSTPIAVNKSVDIKTTAR